MSEKVRTSLEAIGVGGAMPEALRKEFGDDLVDDLIRSGYVQAREIPVLETDASRIPPPSIVTLELTPKGRAKIGLT